MRPDCVRRLWQDRVRLQWTELRVSPDCAVSYAAWGKAKQLSWDGAYDKDNDMCFIGYYDAGNSAYAGYMKRIFSVEDSRELFYNVTNIQKELL